MKLTRYNWRVLVGLGMGMVVMLMLFAPPTNQAATNSTILTAHAQGDGTGQRDADTCEGLIGDALQLTSNVCSGLGRNQACFGYDSVSAVLRNPDAFFEAQGDVVDVIDIETLVTRPLDLDTGEWGIVVMNLQADIPASNGGSVRVLVFGGSNLTPAVPPEEIPDTMNTCTITNNTTDNINIRRGPGTQFAAIDVFDQSSSMEAYAVNSAADWFRTARGWVYAPIVDTTCDTNTLTTVDEPIDSYNAPMQAFTLLMDDEARCQAAPSGMLVQSPSGQTANLMVNNVEIRVGSTALIQSTNMEILVANVEGNVDVYAEDDNQVVPQGSFVTVPLEMLSPNTLQPSGQPSNPSPFSADLLALDTRLFEELPEVVGMPTPWRPVTTTPTRPPATGDDDDDDDDDGRGEGPGQWLPCGSCDTCGHPMDECVTSPDGECLWDPTTCIVERTLTAPALDCYTGSYHNVTATFYAEDGATIDTWEAWSSDSDVATVYVSSGYPGGTTYNVNVQCTNEGEVTAGLRVVDSEGRVTLGSFPITVEDYILY